MKSDESAFSIVPSNLSSRLSVSTSQTGLRDSIGIHPSMVYRQLSFEDELFTARVYKRNYRNPRSQRPRGKEPDLDNKSMTPGSDSDDETVTFQEDRRENKRDIIKLKIRRLMDRKSINDLSKKAAMKISGEDADKLADNERLAYKAIGVTTSVDLSSVGLSTLVQNHSPIKTKQNLGHYNGLLALAALPSPPPPPPISASLVLTPLPQNGSSPMNFSSDTTRLEIPRSTLPSALPSNSHKVQNETSGRGDHDPVKERLARLPATTPQNSDGPALLSRYISGTLGECPIYDIVYAGRVDAMRWVLQMAELDTGINQVVEKVIYRTENERWRPLHMATMKGYLPMVTLLLEKGASVHDDMGFGIQAIHLAASIGSVDLLAVLIAAGADVNCANIYGWRPLNYASNSRDLPNVIEYLAGRGVDIRETFYDGKLAPLDMACKNDFIGNVKALLSFAYGIPFFPLEPALDTAIRHGSLLSVDALLSWGVSPLCCRSDGNSGLHTFFLRFDTMVHRHLSAEETLLRLLLDHIDLLAKDQNGNTVLDSLSHFNFKDIRNFQDASETEMARFLLEYLPNNRVLEGNVLRSMIEKTRLEKLQNDNFARTESPFISGPSLTSNSFGWPQEAKKDPAKEVSASRKSLSISTPLSVTDSLGWDWHGPAQRRDVAGAL